MKINIPKLCHENWDKMTSDEKGRFCTICSESVYDFSRKSDSQVMDFLSNTDKEICGRFKTTQLYKNSEFPFLNSFLAKFAVGLILTSSGWTSIYAQGRIVRSSQQIKMDSIKKEIVIKKDSIPLDKCKIIRPLYILEGKEIRENEFEKINSRSVRGVKVLKDQDAIKNYGEKGRNGAVIISLKNPLYVLDGKVVLKAVIEKIVPDNIKSVKFLTDEKAIAIYGLKAYAVIVITTKK